LLVIVGVGVGCGDQTESVDPAVCASGTRWVGDDDGSSQMHPGRDCIACHAQKGEGPTFTLAGTVFGAPKQADDCFGLPNAVVVVTDATGKTFSMGSNKAGNFTSREAVAFPITAKVLYGDKTIEMKTPVGSGACNSCHTVDGAQGAPGRIEIK
jgi:cytochrome c553